MMWMVTGFVVVIVTLIIVCQRLQTELDLIEFELRVLEAKIAWMKGGTCDE